MDAKEFLEEVLGTEGYVCVIGIKNPEDLADADEKPDQRFYKNIDDAVQQAFEFDNQGINTFFAVSRFETNRTRAAHNVKEIKAFFLDIDCGPTKDYASQADGLKALRGFCKELKLPKPMIVSSGRGLHVYWVLTEAVSRDTWKPVAERFKELCREQELNIDVVVPADAARVLRVIGTHNFKDNPAKPVELIGEVPPKIDFGAFKALLGEGVFKKEYTPRPIDPMMMALAGNYTSKFKTIMMKTVEGRGCEQLKDIVVNQATMSEPQWRAGLSIAAHCSDSATAIHRISNKYPDYSADATETKARGIKGPYLCVRFDEYNPGICPSCQHWNKVKSPINLGREVAEITDEERIVVSTSENLPVGTVQQFEIPKKFPEPYKCGSGGGIFKVTKNDDGDTDDVLVYHNPLYVIKQVRDPDMGWSIVMRLHLPRDGVKEFTIPLSAVTSSEELRKQLSFFGVAVLKIEELKSYIMKWVNMLQMESNVEEARRQFGWTDDECSSFVIGGIEVKKDSIGLNPPASSTVGLFPAFKPKGTLDGWKKAMDFYNRPGFELHQYVMGTGFGSVLMQFSPINGSIFHVHSPGSGLGKTTAMNAGASIWGDPGLLVLEATDTANSKMNRAEVYKNLPLYLDELTNTDPKVLSDLAYQIPNGVQRNRLSSKGNQERFRGAPWKFICVTTGNTSMIERIGLYKAMPKAEAQRILEHHAKAIIFATKEETDIFTTQLENNYGHAGPIFIQYVMNNLEACKEIVLATQRRIDVAAGLTAENRFWSIQAASTIAGLLIAKKAGLIDYDVAPIVKWIVDVLINARTNSGTLGGDVEEIITNYLSANYNNILRIKSTDDARKFETTGVEMILNPDATPRMALVGRYEYDVSKLYLLPKPLKDWCGKQQINYAGLVDGLASGRTKATKVKQRLTKGTHANLPAVNVIMLDCSGFSGAIDETKQEPIASFK